MSRYSETDAELIQRIIRDKFGKRRITDDSITNDDWVHLDNIAQRLEKIDSNSSFEIHGTISERKE
jgi:hypothetical protein